MAEQAEILGQARRLVDAIAPTPVCGECVAGRLGGAPGNEVQMSLSELAAERGYARENDTCGLCGTHGHVIRKRK
jgi:hypothetical protein